MPQFQPNPMVVIRNQLLAYMVLNLLGSCVPETNLQSVSAPTYQCCSSPIATAKVVTSHMKRIHPTTAVPLISEELRFHLAFLGWNMAP